MAVRIRLMRMGKIRNPQYRIVVADARKKRDGRAIENLGLYHPKEEPSRIEVNSERVQHWLSVGAQPSEPVLAILRKTGDWQKFKGLTPPAHPLKVAPARADQHAIYEAEAKAAAGLTDRPGKGEADQAPAKQSRGSGSQASPKSTKKAAKATKAAKKAAKPVEGEASKAEADKAEADKAEADKAEGDKPEAAEATDAGESGDATGQG